MRMSVGAGDFPPALETIGAPGAPGPPDRRPLLELVLSLAQIQYEMESRRRGGLSTAALRAAEEPLVDELHRRGVPIPQRAPQSRGELGRPHSAAGEDPPSITW